MNKQSVVPSLDEVMGWLGQGAVVTNAESGDAVFTNGMSDAMAEYVDRIGTGGQFTEEEDAAFAEQVDECYAEGLLGAKLV